MWEHNLAAHGEVVSKVNGTLTPQSIREVLELLMKNPSIGRELGDRAQSLYRESFEPAVIVSRLRDIAGAVEIPKKLATAAAASRGSQRISNG
jgi:plasmid stabilization system protein ParE